MIQPLRFAHRISQHIERGQKPVSADRAKLLFDLRPDLSADMLFEGLAYGNGRVARTLNMAGNRG